MAELVLQLKKINKYFGKNHVIKNVDLEFEKGHFITFLGPSGCGKTTLLRMIASSVYRLTIAIRRCCFRNTRSSRT